ncbi:MAG: hypothetical protein PHQ75_02990 [Thermoguttaceae bacterium]|nr:hypothetical protein [Thermoguttaceae bacterium]
MFFPSIPEVSSLDNPLASCQFWGDSDEEDRVLNALMIQDVLDDANRDFGHRDHSIFTPLFVLKGGFCPKGFIPEA